MEQVQEFGIEASADEYDLALIFLDECNGSNDELSYFELLEN